MKKEARTYRAFYVGADYVCTLGGFLLFSLCRWGFVPSLPEQYKTFANFMDSWGMHASMLLFPLFMLLVYYLTGVYVRTVNKSRLDLLLRTLAGVAIGTLVFFMVALLNDVLPRRRYNYELMAMMFGCLSACVYTGRFIVATTLKWKLGGTRPYTLISPTRDVAYNLAKVNTAGEKMGFEITNILKAGDPEEDEPQLDELRRLVAEGKSAGVVIAPSLYSAPVLQRLLHSLYTLGVPVFVDADDKALMLGGVVKFTDIGADALIDITRSDLPDAVVAIKRFGDVVFGSLGLLLTAPLIFVLGLLVKMQSGGPMFYAQERIGYHRKPFKIYKLRSMRSDAEPEGPRLSSDNDPRVTSIGRILRKYRLDELPNLWNVVKGDMSLVGPRPEREFFIREIVKVAPHYTLLHQVRPGLTSWGMVKFGYASNVDEMVKRLKYDILYIQNLSLTLDIRIMLHTVLTIVNGEGK